MELWRDVRGRGDDGTLWTPKLVELLSEVEASQTMKRGRHRIEDGLTNQERYHKTPKGRAVMKRAYKRYFPKYSWALKASIVAKYSPTNSCMKCGISDIRVLTIDHIKGDGAEQRRLNRIRGGYPTYVWLQKNEFPEGFQVLCYNCQKIKQIENREFVKPGSVYK